MEPREITIKGYKRKTKNPYLSQEPVPVITIKGKWLILKGYRAGKQVQIRSQDQKLILNIKEKKEPPKYY
jgi:hypothetical protein